MAERTRRDRRWRFCASAQALPHCVYLNRGNHEDLAINSVYGFLGECNTKYSRLVYSLFNMAFQQLPLATIVDDQTIVLHAGEIAPRCSRDAAET